MKYLLLPTCMSAPVFTSAIWQQGFTTYPSVMRVLMQTRDLTWYLLVQLGMVKNDTHTRRRFMATVTNFADAEDGERQLRRAGDAGPLLKILDAYKAWVLMLADVQESIIVEQEEFEREKAVNSIFKATLGRNRATSAGKAPAGSEAGEGSQSESKPTSLWSKLRSSSRASVRKRRASVEVVGSRADVVRNATLALLKAIEESADRDRRPLSANDLNISDPSQTPRSAATPRDRTPRTPHTPRGPLTPRQRAQRGWLFMTDALFSHKESAAAIATEARLRRARKGFLQELRDMLELDDVQAIGDSLPNLASDPSVLQSLFRCFTTNNPTGQPENPEASRQLIFFANSLHNRRLVEPPPVQEMKSWTVFTPHYSEEVTRAIRRLLSLP